MKSFEPEELPGIGWIRIYETGDENIYFKFTDSGGSLREGFCKVDGYKFQGVQDEGNN